MSEKVPTCACCGRDDCNRIGLFCCIVRGRQMTEMLLCVGCGYVGRRGPGDRDEFRTERQGPLVCPKCGASSETADRMMMELTGVQEPRDP